MRAHSLVLFGLVVSLSGCKLLKSSGDAADAGPATITSADAGVAAKASCTVESPPEVLEKWVRIDSGVTVTVLADGRTALGYATGEGAPHALVLDDAGKATHVEVLAGHLAEEKKQSPKTVRNILRVTPLGFAGQKMRVGVDMTDTNPDKTKYLRCGPADQEPYVAELPNEENKADDAGQIDDCRTFSNGHRAWVLSSARLVSEAMENEMPMAWTVDEKPGKETIKDQILDKKRYPAAKFEHVDPLVYQVPVGTGVNGVGYVFASRHEGALVVAHRNGELQKAGDATKFALGGSITMPAIALRGKDVALFTGLMGKTELFGSHFSVDGKPVKPEKILLDDPSPPTEGERNSVAASFSPGGGVYVVFADGKSGAKRARLARVDTDMKSTMPVFDVVSTPGAVSEVRVHAVTDTKVIVTYLAQAEGKGFELTRTVLSCAK
jgi:hypothetical protein